MLWRFFNTGLVLVRKKMSFFLVHLFSVPSVGILIKLIAVEKAKPGVFFPLLELVDLVFAEYGKHMSRGFHVM